jgi:hypothetical protein
MKQPLIFLLAIFAASAANANPFFGVAENQMYFHFGLGTDTTWLFANPAMTVPFSIFNFQYSQPSVIFRLPARESVNISYAYGWGRTKNHDAGGANPNEYWDWKKYSIPIVYFSEDVALYHTDSWYFGAGIAVGVQAVQNERIGSKSLSGIKLFAGHRISGVWSTELFMQHFSNGSTAPQNNSYNFYGLGFGYNF